MRRLLIKSGMVVRMDRSVPDLARGDVLIGGDRILDVAPAIQADDAEVIDAGNAIVMPGFVDAHLHTWQTCLRGIAADWTIPEYLHTMHAAIAPAFAPGDIYISNLMGALSQLDAGTTTLVDWCHNNPTPAHTDAAIDALEESGIRAVFLHARQSPIRDRARGISARSRTPAASSSVSRAGGSPPAMR
jgi:5-methylthioadenosine/S-adenosylhomocysteine deaminase